MTIREDHELSGLRRAGQVVSDVLRALEARVEPGTTTREIDAHGAQLLARAEARPAPAQLYGFPGALCISVNDEAVHGVPSDRVVAPGDLVKLDLVAELDGYYADAARTVAVPPVTPENAALARAARRALARARREIRAGVRIRRVGRAIERSVRGAGFRVIPELGGHGVGRSIHEEPSIPNFDDPEAEGRLHAGLVIAVEPIVTSGSGRIFEADDGWTIRTADAAPVAHHEQTLVVTHGAPIVLTA